MTPLIKIMTKEEAWKRYKDKWYERIHRKDKFIYNSF